MARPKGTVGIPSYRLHRASGRAVCTIAGRDYYLGRHGSEQSRQAYNRLIAEYMASGRQGPGASNEATATVAEIAAAFLSDFTSRPKAATTLDQWRTNIRWLVDHYGDTLAKDFGPRELKLLRTKMIGTKAKRVECGKVVEYDRTLARDYINKIIGSILEIFRWATEEGILSPSIHHGLRCVRPLRFGAGGRETDRVRPVDDRDLNAVLSVASPIIQRMITLQLLTGMRPGELCRMRVGDIVTTGKVWTYVPPEHKTAHRGIKRTIFLGPKAQEIIRPRLQPDLKAYIFSPRDAYVETMKSRTANGKFPRVGSKAKNKIPSHIGECFNPNSYYLNIRAACKRAERERLKGVSAGRFVGGRAGLAIGIGLEHSPAKGEPFKHWHPHQLRHNAATHLRAEFGLDVAQTILGHSTTDMTEVYAERDVSKAIEAIARVG